MKRPHIVLLGGALRPNSSTERLLRLAGRKAEAAGAHVTFFCGADIDFPAYAPERVQPITAASKMIAALMSADGIIVGSPGYHGSISGLVKNALDYVEQMRSEPRPYFDGRPVGCIVTAAGWQGAVSTLNTLRDIVHALRGWPTPLGVTVNTASPDDGDPCNSLEVHRQLDILVDQVLGFCAVGRDAKIQPSHGRNGQFAAETRVL